MVYGGGGITPDVIVEPDTMTEGEQALLRALREAEVSFYDVALRFALGWKRANPGLDRDFTVTPEMRSAFFDYLGERTDGALDREVLVGASDFLDYQLARQVAYAAFGESAAIERALVRSQAMAAARAYLGQAETPAQLLAIAEADRARSARDRRRGSRRGLMTPRYRLRPVWTRFNG